VGIPRALNMYENYPFWHAFFTKLGFSVVLSDKTTRKTYEAGTESMPSESVCYPAKLSHGHVMDLLEKDPDFIWMPCIRWERQGGCRRHQPLQLPDRHELSAGARAQRGRAGGAERGVPLPIYPL